MDRARLGCDADIRVTSDGPLRLTLDGCDRTIQVGKGTSRVGCVSRRSFCIRVPKRLRARVNLRGRKRGRYTVRIVARTRGGKVVRSKRVYRTCAKKRARR